ncbi:MAG: CbbQ/NirQ/NorQ/GpvN family protein, partial [Chloroflexi bacterium]|nr:CbbQ/NirQ/NorQ/GpvN family protein [Chloroflexota bacterium]
MSRDLAEARVHAIETHRVTAEPYYEPVGDEVRLFEAAYADRIPVLLKGPTGCGKTRFMEYMTWYLGDRGRDPLPLVTIACHEDLVAGDLVGRYILSTSGTDWLDGPLTRAVRAGGICYLDEVVEARKDTTVIIHSLTDYRRVLPIEKRGLIMEAHPNFLLCMSYNPGYQSALKDLKHSTRQRFVAIEFGYPPRALEERIVAHEAGVGAEQAAGLALLAEKIRNLDKDAGAEGPSTRLLIYAGMLMRRGVGARRACEIGVVQAMTDDEVLQSGLREVV